uniref:Putative ADP-ribosylation factor-binding protein C1F3.05 n=1 Tax=Anthurium amnicola TaxID=1678845 RepID=A0A1D1YLQ6_9ARAE
MIKSSKPAVLTFAERCKNILAANWQAQLNTVKADAKGSKEDIHSSRVKYLLRRGKPYLWVQEGDLHNVNTVIDERGSLSVSTPVPGPLMSLLRSIKKLPARVALTGDVIPLREGKVQSAIEGLKETVILESRIVNEASYSVYGVLRSSSAGCRPRSDIFQEILDGNNNNNYVAYKFNIRTCTYIDASGGTHEVELNDVESSKEDLLLPFSERLIDGINQSQARRRALMFFCFIYLNANARDAFMLSIDKKGFDILAKVPCVVAAADGLSNYQWKEFRISFKEEVPDMEAFCNLLVEMEAATLRDINSYSGLCSRKNLT